MLASPGGSPITPVHGSAGKSHSELSPAPTRSRDRWGRENRSELRPEKPCLGTEGRGFDSRHLHNERRTIETTNALVGGSALLPGRSSSSGVTQAEAIPSSAVGV